MKINDVPLSDLIHPQTVKGFDGDLKWHFTKLAGVKGIFDTNIEAFDPNTTLVCSYTTHTMYFMYSQCIDE
jgi:hypothetical protein